MSLPQKYNLLAKHINPIYIETGIWRGDSIQQAIDAGFETIIGIDNDIACLEFCDSRFALNDFGSGKVKNSMVWLRQGDSAEALYDIIKNISGRTTFFLDSHWQMLEHTEPGRNPFPLLKELDQIARAGTNFNDSTIIIDDMLIFQQNITGYDRHNILFYLNKINPNFQFEEVANPVIGGILIAKP